MGGELLHGRYELLETLGAGGEGRVVKALDHQHDRLVALKIFSVCGAADREELLGEARILLGLAPHPALPLVREDFFDGDEYVVAMDWVDGTDLEKLLRIRGHPGLAPSSVLAYLADAADALTYLHTRDEPVVHGDIKPANLILGRGGRVKVVDFGMSSEPGSRGRRAGTPGFRAPELENGGVPSRASDVYSLAATAFTLLTGSVPSGTSPTWDGIDPDQAARLDEAMRLGLATDPARRPKTPGELVERLRAGWGASLPTGVTTFCLTDIVGSTALWEEHPDAMPSALVRHDDLIAEAVETHGGHFLRSKGEGDSTLSVFDSAADAVSAAIAVTEALAGEDWPGGIELTVRCGLHTGEADRSVTDHYGPTVNLAARLRGQADGREIFVSSVTADLVAACLPAGYRLVDLGPHHLRGLHEPERVFALAGPGVVAPLPATECPYRGLEAFEASDRRFFFGREEVVAELTARLAPGSLLALVGASGSGKSSVLRAGLVGAAQEGLIGGVTGVELCTPGPAPAVDGQGPPGGLLVVDQFEELFTVCDDEAKREAFVDALLAYPGPVVIGVRADFYGRVSTHPALARAVASNQILLGPMTPDELRRAITEPARAAGLRLEAGLADVILRDVAGEPGALPLLSHALRATWELRDGRTLTVDGYRETGGVSSAIARTADRVVQTTPHELRPLLRNMFLRLTEIGGGIQDTRRRVDIDDLVPERGSKSAVHTILERLADARLVTLRAGTAEVAHEALIREWPALRTWLEEDQEGLALHRRLGDTARLWATGGHEPSDLYRGTRLEAAREWAQNNPETLNATERAFLDASLELADRERVEQARQVKTQARTNRRLRRLLAGVAIALVVALVAATFAFVQRNRAEDATRRATVGRLVAESGVQRDRDRSLSALLAVGANRLDDNAATRGALQKVLMAEPRLQGTLAGRSPEYGSLGYTPDGTKIIVRAFPRGAVDVFDTRRHRLSGPPMRVPGEASGGLGFGLAVSPDGKEFAIGGGDHRLHVFDVRSRREVGPPMRVAAPVIGVAYSPDGSILASAAGVLGDSTPIPTERTVQLWDVASRRPLAVSLGGHTASVNSVAFSPDGGLLATGGNDHLVVMHDTRTGATVGAPLRIDSVVYSLAFSPDGSRLAVTGQGQNAFVFDVRTGLQVGPTLAAGAYSPVAFSPDGSRLVTSSFTGNSTIVWDAATLTPIGAPMVPGGIGVAFRPDGHEIAVAGTSKILTLWDPDGQTLFTRGIPSPSPNGGQFSPDGKFLGVPDLNGVTLYDARTLEPVGPPLPVPGGTPLAGPLGGPTPVPFRFSPDGTRLALAGVTVDFYDVATLRQVGPSVPLGSVGGLVEFSPDGKMLAVGGARGDLYLVDLPSGRRRGPLPGLSYFVLNATFSPDGRRLAATTANGIAVIYDHLGRAEPRARPLPQANDVNAARFSPDGSLLATGAGDGTVQLRDGRTLRPLGPSIATNKSYVLGIGFSPDGRLLAVADVSFTVRLVDVASRQPIGDPFVGAGYSTVAKSFRPDGRILALSGSDGPALVTLDFAEWRADVCRLAGRNLTPAESREYLGTGGPRVDACPGYPNPR